MKLTHCLFTILAIAIVVSIGCSRSKYRLRADADSYGILHEKTDGTPWQPPLDYSVYPQPHSRLYNDPCIDDPSLPNPAPQLYAYDLPEAPERNPKRFLPSDDESNFEYDAESADLPNGDGEPIESIEASPETPNNESVIPPTPPLPMPQPPGDASSSDNPSNTAARTIPSTDTPTLKTEVRLGSPQFQTVSFQEALDD